MSNDITVIDVCRSLGIQPNKHMMWKVGVSIRKQYMKDHGTLPPKELRPKTYEGKGSHCFAVYPENMREFIAQEIITYNDEEINGN